MKKKIIILILSISIMSLQWVYVLNDIRTKDMERRNIYENALEDFNDELYIKAIDGFKKLNSDDYEINMYLLKGYIKLDDRRNIKEQFEKLLEIDKYKYESYVEMLKYYISKNSYSEIYQYLDISSDIESELLDKIREDYLYIYTSKKLNFEDIKPFMEGKDYSLIPVKKDGKWALADKKGELFTKFIFDDIGSYSDKYKVFPAKIYDTWSYYTLEGNKFEKIGNQYLYVGPKDKYIQFENKEGFGYLDENFNIVLEKMDYVSPFRDKLAVIKEGEKYKVINQKFEIVIDDIEDIKTDSYGFVLNDGLIMIKKDSWGIYNAKGDLLIDGFLDIDISNGDIIAFKKDKLYGYMTKEGRVVIEEKFDEALSFKSSLGLVKIGDEYKFISKGEDIIIDDFTNPFYISSYGSVIINKNGEYQNVNLRRFEE